MSQQHMESDEFNRGYTGTRVDAYPPDEHFMGGSGQKIGQQGSSVLSGGQRLALAIVSMCLFVLACIIAIPVVTDGGSIVDIARVGTLVTIVALLSITTMVVNYIFSRRG